MSASTVMDRARDDERLIRDGDHARLLERYRYPISQRVRLKVPERDVDDVVSEVILFLYRELASGKTYGVPFGVVVARRTGWMIAEYHERGVPVPQDLSEADLGSVGPGDVSDQGYVRRLLAVLPPRDRDVAKLRFLLGFEVAEIATHLAMEPNAVHQAVWRARRRLRELLDG